MVHLEGYLDRPDWPHLGRSWHAGFAAPEGLSQTDVLTVVLAITGIGGAVFRKTAKARIE